MSTVDFHERTERAERAERAERDAGQAPAQRPGRIGAVARPAVAGLIVVTGASLIGAVLVFVAAAFAEPGALAGIRPVWSAFPVVWASIGSLALFGDVSIGHANGAADLVLSVAAAGRLSGAPLLITLVTAAAVARGSYRQERRAASPDRATRIRRSIASGGIVAGGAELLALAGSFFGGWSLIPAGLQLLVGAVIVGSLAAMAGRSLAGVARPGIDRPQSLLLALPGSFRPLAAAAAAALVVFVPVGLLVGGVLVAGRVGVVSAILTAPLWVGQAVGWSLTLGGLGRLGLDSGSVASPFALLDGTGTTTDSFGVTDGPALLWMLVVAALVALVLAARALDAVRPDGRRNLRHWWVLPLQAAGLALVAGHTVAAISIAVPDLYMGDPVALHVAPTLWAVPLAGCWGAAVELVARAVVPAWQPPRRAGRDAAIRTASLLLAGLLVLGIAAAAASTIVQAVVFSPEATVSRYANAIAEGDYRTAESMVHTRSDVAKLPLPAPADRMKVTGIQTVHAGDIGGDEAVVELRYLVGTKAAHARLELVRRSGQPGWTLQTGLLTGITVEDTIDADATIDGARFGRPYTGGMTIPLYPGVYHPAVSGDYRGWLTMPGRVAVTGGGAVLRQRPTSALTKSVQSQVDAELDTCARSVFAAPDRCDFSTSQYLSDEDYTGLAWSITSYPKVVTNGITYSSDDCGGGATARYVDDEGEQQVDTAECFDVSGDLRFDESGVHLDATHDGVLDSDADGSAQDSDAGSTASGSAASSADSGAIGSDSSASDGGRSVDDIIPGDA